MRQQIRKRGTQLRWGVSIASAVCLFMVFSLTPGVARAANNGRAYVRFANGLPGQAASLNANGRKTFTNVPYGDVTSYKPMNATHTKFDLFEATAHPNPAPLNTQGHGLGSGNYYTVYAAPNQNGSEPKLNIEQDTTNRPNNGKAKVKVINASVDHVTIIAPKLANNESGTKANKLFSSVNPSSAAGYNSIHPVSGTLNVEPSNHGTNGYGNNNGRNRGYAAPNYRTAPNSNNQQRLLSAVPIASRMRAGQVYTIFVTGGSQRFPLTAKIINDHQSTGAGMNAAQGDPR